MEWRNGSSEGCYLGLASTDKNYTAQVHAAYCWE